MEGETAAAEGVVVIVGAGIAGLATALGLHRKGTRSLVLESAPALRATGFAFTTYANAFRALDALGIGEKIRASHTLIERLIVTSAVSGVMATKTTLNDGGKQGKREIRCVRRDYLLEMLASELPEGTIRYSSKLVTMDEGEGGHVKVLHLSDGSTIRAKVVIGCDGVNSVVAKWLGLKRVLDSGRVAARGLFDAPHGHSFDAEFLQFFGADFRYGLLPCNARNIYWFFAWRRTEVDQENGAEENAATTREFILAKLRQTKVPDQVIGVVQRSEMDDVAVSHLRYRSPFSLMTADISKGNVCVAGDALHPMTPDIGQGGCAALEDAVVLAHCLSRADLNVHSSVVAALDEYAARRRWRSIHVITVAYLVGFIQQSQNPILAFLRVRFMSGMLARAIRSVIDYDCGML